MFSVPSVVAVSPRVWRGAPIGRWGRGLGAQAQHVKHCIVAAHPCSAGERTCIDAARPDEGAIDADGGARAQDNNFTLHGAQSVADDGVGVRDLLALCLAENDRRFAGYDERLLRPRTVPRLARLALRLSRPFDWPR